jgi:hypothetical protein
MHTYVDSPVATLKPGVEKATRFFTAHPGPRGPQLGEKPLEFFTTPHLRGQRERRRKCHTKSLSTQA